MELLEPPTKRSLLVLFHHIRSIHRLAGGGLYTWVLVAVCTIELLEDGDSEEGRR